MNGLASTGWAPWAMGTLAFRTVAFLAVQGSVALVFAARGGEPAQSSRFWLMSAAVGNLATLGWLKVLTEREGLSLRSLFGVDGRHWKLDLKAFLLTLLVGGPLAFFPMQWASAALWGDAAMGSRLMFVAAPGWVIFGAGLVFVVSQPFAELPTYCGYVLPRLQACLGSWAAVALVTLALSAQHVALPFVLDCRFTVWRATMYLPFALLTVVSIQRRPTLMPWFMGMHFLMDLQLPALVWLVSTGRMQM